jgi:hypothetical protein
MKRSRTTKRGTRGMAMVEMVFVLPILVLLVFAIAEFGLMFSRWLTLSNAVREGAREGVVFRKPCDSTTVDNIVKGKVVSYAQAGGLPLQKSDVTVIGDSCGVNGSQLQVKSTYPFELMIPFAHLDPVDLAYSSTMRHE